MTFADPQVKKCFDSQFAEAADASDALRQIRALIATHDLFQMLEGPHSTRVHDTMAQLLLPGVRPGLRQWYLQAGATPDRAAVELRNQLRQLTGEQFGAMTFHAKALST